MSFSKRCLRSMVLFYDVCFCLVCTSKSYCGPWNTNGFAVSRGLHTYSGTRVVLGGNPGRQAASKTCFLLRRGNKQSQARPLSRRRASHAPCCSPGGRAEGASLLHYAASCVAGATPNQTFPHTGLPAFAACTAAGPGAADASAALSSPVTSFSAGIDDTSLPPQSSDPPLVDRALCRGDLLRGSADGRPQEGGSPWQPLGGGLLRTVPPEGPVSYFDGREEMHPSLVGASDDAFFFDFYGPLQLGALEVAQTALSAAKRFVRTRTFRDHLDTPTALSAPANVHKLQKGKPRGSLSVQRQDAANVFVGSTNLSALLEEERFLKAPHWLSERVAYILRYLRPPSFGFLVAQMLHAICRVAETERKLGVSLDEYAACRMQTYVQKTQQKSPEEHFVHFSAKGDPWQFKDVLKFRRGFPLFPWGLPKNPQATRSFLQQQLQVTEEVLTQVGRSPSTSCKCAHNTRNPFSHNQPSLTVIINLWERLRMRHSAPLQHFFAARRVAGQAGARPARYRLPEEEVPVEGSVRRRVYEGFNSAAVECIKHLTFVRFDFSFC